jgi:hypothetical protein
MAPLNRLLAEVTIPPISGPGVAVGANGTLTLEKIISQIIGVLTIFGVIFFIIQVIIGGYAFIAAQGDPKAIEIARQRLTWGILGLTVVIVAVGLGSLIATIAGITNVLDLDALLGSMGLTQP